MDNLRRFCFQKSFISIVTFLFFLIIFVMPASGLQCYRCGQYTDGPGSITPCLNYTDDLHLKECPPDANQHCIKYVNEGSTVRECADECNEKRSDSWGTSIYCCTLNACNSGSFFRSSRLAGTLIPVVAILNPFPRLFLL